MIVTKQDTDLAEDLLAEWGEVFGGSPKIGELKSNSRILEKAAETKYHRKKTKSISTPVYTCEIVDGQMVNARYDGKRLTRAQVQHISTPSPRRYTRMEDRHDPRTDRALETDKKMSAIQQANPDLYDVGKYRYIYRWPFEAIGDKQGVSKQAAIKRLDKLKEVLQKV